MFSGLINLIKRAVSTSTANDSSVTQLTQIKYYDKVSQSEIIHDYGFSSSAPRGSVVYCFSCGGNEQNLIGIANHVLSRFKNLSEGEVVIGNQLTGTYIKFDKNGDIIIGGGNVIIEQNLLVKGDITDNSGSNSATLKTLRDAYNGHTHTSAPPGNQTSTTDMPV